MFYSGPFTYSLQQRREADNKEDLKKEKIWVAPVVGHDLSKTGLSELAPDRWSPNHEIPYAVQNVNAESDFY